MHAEDIVTFNVQISTCSDLVHYKMLALHCLRLVLRTGFINKLSQVGQTIIHSH